MASKSTQHWLARAVDAERRQPAPDWRLIAVLSDRIAQLDDRDRVGPLRAPAKLAGAIILDEDAKAPWLDGLDGLYPEDDPTGSVAAAEAARRIGTIDDDHDTEKE